MATLATSFISCGVQQLYGLHEQIFLPDGSTEQIAVETQLFPVADRLKSAIVIFSDTEKLAVETEKEGFDPENELHQGRRLAALITTHKLGTIQESARVTNPNTGNTVRLWTWVVDKRAVTLFVNKYRAEQKKKKEERDESLKTLQTELVSKTITLADILPVSKPVTVKGPSDMKVFAVETNRNFIKKVRRGSHF